MPDIGSPGIVSLFQSVAPEIELRPLGCSVEYIEAIGFRDYCRVTCTDVAQQCEMATANNVVLSDGDGKGEQPKFM